MKKNTLSIPNQPASIAQSFKVVAVGTYKTKSLVATIQPPIKFLTSKGAGRFGVSVSIVLSFLLLHTKIHNLVGIWLPFISL